MDTEQRAAYRLTWDSDHLEQLEVDYDVHLISQEWVFENLIVYQTEPPVGLPLPVEFEAAHGFVGLLDFPCPSSATAGWPIVSRRMLEVLNSLPGFACHPMPVSVQGVQEEFFCLQLTRLEDGFETPVTNDRVSDTFEDDLEPFNFLEPEGGFPALFRLRSSPTTLFVSGKTRAALNAAGIRGVAYGLLDSYVTETDTPVGLPIRATVLQ
jgi:hypothetical protein